MTSETYKKAAELMKKIGTVQQYKEFAEDLQDAFDSAKAPKTLHFEGYSNKAINVSIETARSIVRIVYDSLDAEFSKLSKQMEEL